MITQIATVAHDTLAAVRDSGYVHGMIVGGSVFGILGAFLGLVVAAFLHAAAGEPPAPGTRISLVPTLGESGRPADSDLERFERVQRRGRGKPRGAA